MSVQPHVRTLVEAFLLNFQDVNDIDETLLDYITEFLLDPELSGSGLDDLDEIIATTCPDFESQPSETRLTGLHHLRDQVAALRNNGAGSNTAHPGLQSVAPIQSVVGKQSVTPTAHWAAGESACHTSSQYASGAEEASAAQHLAALCPEGTCLKFLQHILQSYCDGDLQRAAEWVLECEDIQRRQAVWQTAAEKKKKEEEEARKAEQRVRKEILARFDLQVRKTEDDMRRDAAKPLRAWTTEGEGTKAKQVRYREGMVVSTKGEKYVVQKLGEEWDGGSKGKVYTKGKRGKGFA